MPCRLPTRQHIVKAYPWKSYRLRPETVALLAALREALKRSFLSYDELIMELVTFYLAYHRTLRGRVERLRRGQDEPRPENDVEREDFT